MQKNLHTKNKSRTFALELRKQHRGVEQLVARQAHNLEVACSSPASATTSVRNTFKQRVSDTFRFRAGTQFGTQVQRYNIGAIEQQC